MSAPANLNWEVFKLPLGFLRAVELPLSILTFATTTAYNAGCFSIGYNCSGTDEKQNMCFSYPFRLSLLTISSNMCKPELGSVPLFRQDYNSSAEFFVAVGVLAFLYCLASLVGYVLMWGHYSNNDNYPKFDLLITAVLAFFWFVGTCAWANGVVRLKGVTDFTSFKSQVETVCHYSEEKCKLEGDWNYASLNVSLILGFLCSFVWAANLWFIYKETVWFKSRTDPNNPSAGLAGPGGFPPGAAAPNQSYQ